MVGGEHQKALLLNDINRRFAIDVINKPDAIGPNTFSHVLNHLGLFDNHNKELQPDHDYDPLYFLHQNRVIDTILVFGDLVG